VKTLLVLRHAKSSWDEASLDDHDRPLAPRGRKALPLLARHLQHRVTPPELVLCSSAERARETLAGVARALGGPRVEIEGALYMAGADSLLDRLRSLPADTGVVMLVGHNPGLQSLVLALASEGDALGEVRAKFATGALATIELDVDTWADVAPGTGRLTGLVTPRALR
jgi:phosphohistidine phosphatase